MEEIERVRKIMVQLQLNSAQFALEIGIQGSTLSHLLNGRNKPSLDVLKKVLSRYPNINSDWLIMGIGAMYRGEKDSQTPNLFAFQDETVSLPTVSAPISMPKFEPPVAPIQQPKVYAEPKSIVSAPENPSALPTELNSVMPVVNVETTAKSVRKIIVYYTDNTFQEFLG